MNQHLQSILDTIQKDVRLSADEKSSLSKSLKDADKELEITAFELERTEKLKRTTAILLEETIEELEQKRKAIEEQNKELEIETALETVRTVAMSMSKPDDMLHVCRMISDQLHKLGFKEIRNVQTVIFYQQKHEYLNYQYFTPYDKTSIEVIDYQLHPDVLQFTEKMLESADAYYTKTFEGDELNVWRQYRKETNQLPDPKLDETSSTHYYFYSIGSGALGVTTYAALTENQINLFKRFRNVFDLAYRRFIDIQKAEAQAREAQIQLALERVRARTMAMQKSGELSETVYILFQQFKDLGEDPIQITIGIFNQEEKLIRLNITGFYGSGSRIDQSFDMDINEPSLLNKLYIAWKEEKKSMVLELAGKELFDWITYRNFVAEKYNMASTTINRDDRRFVSAGFFSKGFISFSKSESIPYQTMQILERFASVFEQTYTRFLDLQKVEAQAREAHIELALERVRARTMAMHKSDELPEISSLLFQQAKELGETAVQNSIGIVNEETGFIELSTTIHGSHLLHTLNVPMNDPHLMAKGVAAWKAKHKSLTVKFEGEELKKYYELRNSFLETKISFPEDQWIVNLSFFSKGWLSFSSNKNVSGEIVAVQKRFAKVFEQTYTRFLDLQKAEAQTREAKIEAAMEKVRSRALAMQKPDELVEVAQLLRREMNLLGVEELETSSIYIHHEETGRTECWYAIKDVTYPEKELVSDHMAIDLNETEVGRQMLAFYRSEKKQISIPMQGDARKEWINYCAEHSKVLSGFYGDTIPDRTYHLYKFSNGYMGAASSGDISTESWDLLQRATSVFSFAYTRFSDLQKAQAQAREAQIEAALERVRSRTMAMQKSEELAETAAVLFKQLIFLGIEPNRLYINIIKNETGDAEFWITDEDGSKVSSAFETNLNKNPTFKKMLDGWTQQKGSVTIDMQGKELQEYFDYLSSIHVPFKGGLTQKRRLQYIAYFSNGFIGMASPDEQPDGTMLLLERFAAVFNLTFTRFNDLQLAEAHAVQAEQDLIEIKAARKKAEDALSELQVTQTQLIQSEKMASLGELTAGIAHEIQNPLNFVNNFSEVSNELISEMVEEIDKGSTEEIKVLAKDVQQNLEKILHHGKRADAIVKGMLQHSRSSSGKKEPTDINALADEYLRLAYHGLRAKDKSFNAKFETDFDNNIGNINIIPQDIGRAILNLITNAFYAVTEKKKQQPEDYEPTVSVSTKRENGKVVISVKDNGNGIQQKVLDKIFQPFFTTKPTGQGTGLGLSLSYDIVKAHGGELKVETKEGEGTQFSFLLNL
jgi:signal transduction histidine kinase